MNGTGEAVARVWIVNRIIAKRHIADNCIKIIIREGRFFKALREYCGVGVEFPGNPRGERVKFNACPMTALQSIWHKPEEMPYSHSRLKHLNVLTQAEL